MEWLVTVNLGINMIHSLRNSQNYSDVTPTNALLVRIISIHIPRSKFYSILSLTGVLNTSVGLKSLDKVVGCELMEERGFSSFLYIARGCFHDDILQSDSIIFQRVIAF